MARVPIDRLPTRVLLGPTDGTGVGWRNEAPKQYINIAWTAASALAYMHSTRIFAPYLGPVLSVTITSIKY